MDHFIIALHAVAPLFAKIGVGAAARAVGLVSEQDRVRLNKFFYHYFMPFLTFKSVYFSVLAPRDALGALAFVFAALLVVTLLTLPAAAFIEPRRSERGVIVQAVVRSNVIIMAMPMLGAMYPEENMALAAVVCTLYVVAINVISVTVLEIYNGSHVNGRTILVDLLKNPMIIGFLAAFALKGLGIVLPGPIAGPVRFLGAAANVIMLFLLGTFFRLRDIGTSRKSLFFSVIGRLIAVPGLVIPAAIAAGFRGYLLALIVCIFATPTAVNSFSLVKEIGGDAELAANIVVVSTALSCVTLCLWITLLGALKLI